MSYERCSKHCSVGDNKLTLSSILSHFQLSWELKLTELRWLSWAACDGEPSKVIYWDYVLVGCSLCGSMLYMPRVRAIASDQSNHRQSQRTRKEIELHYRLNPKSPKRQTLHRLSFLLYVFAKKVETLLIKLCLQVHSKYRITLVCFLESPYPLGYRLKKHLLKSNLQSFRRFF